MTVEIRTNPPIAALYMSGAYNSSLTADPFHELGGKGNNQGIERALKIDTSKEMTPELLMKFNADAEKYNLKHYTAVSIFIEGLDEFGVAAEINGFQGRIDKDPNGDVTAFLKGTRFGGKSRSMNGVIANILKSNLPSGVVLKTGVKMKWELADLVRYGCAIRDALEQKGIAQPKKGYAGAKSGLLSGFSIHAVS